MGVLGLNTDRNWSFKAFAFPVSAKKEFGHPSSREQCQMTPAWND